MAKRFSKFLPTLLYLIWLIAQFIIIAALLLRSIGTGLDPFYIQSLWMYYLYSTGLISLFLLLLPFLKKWQLLSPNKTLIGLATILLILCHALGFLYLFTTLYEPTVQDYPIPIFVLSVLQILTVAMMIGGTLNIGLQFQRMPINRIFISYSRKDGEVAHQIKNMLQDHGFDVEIDVEAFAFGDHIQNRIIQAIKNTDLTIGLISENSLRSVWVGLELINTVLKEKLENQKRFIGVLLDDRAFSDTFYNELRSHLKTEKQRLDMAMAKAIEEGDGVGRYNEDHKRVRDYIHYQDDLFRRLQQFIQADAGDPKVRQKNLEQLIKQLKTQTRLVKDKSN